MGTGALRTGAGDRPASWGLEAVSDDPAAAA